MVVSALQSLFSLSATTAVTAMSLLGAGLIWWIIRKRLKDFWFPIVRILEIPVSRLPRIIIKKPPMIPFFMFLLCGLGFLLWTTKPSLKIFSDFEPGVSQVHVYVDMSPSVSAQVTVSELGQKLVAILEQLGSRARVTFGTSHGPDVYELTGASSAADLIAGLGFHRGGGKIGSGVRAQITRIGEIDQLFVVSDRDQHSWSGFQWQYLLVDSDIRHVDVDGGSVRPRLPNVFIQDARFTSAPGSLTMDWEVEIAEGAFVRPSSGTITASLGGSVLATENWDIPEGRRSALVTASWPATLVSRDSIGEPIEWSLEVSGGDAMTMDNKFRSPVLGRRDRVVVIGEPSGELRLEDALMPLETALQVSGFEVERFDRWPSKIKGDIPEVVSSARFIAVLTGDQESLDMWCPATGESMVPVWFVPTGEPTSFSAMCRCLSNFAVGITADMCDGGLSREQWIATLVDVGAAQIGGDIGFANQAVALRLAKSDRNLDFTLLTIPLRPMRQTGLTWGVFPVLVRQLAAFASGGGMGGLTAEDGVRGIWPRISDVMSIISMETDPSSGKTQLLRETNVPVGESMLANTLASDLPPSLNTSGVAGRMRAPSKRDSDDPQPWIRMLLACVLIAICIELVWLWRRRKINQMGIRLLIVLSFGVPFRYEVVFAQVRIEWLGVKPSGEFQFQNLSREVSSRTSLDFAGQPSLFASFDVKTEQLPWIWTANPGLLADKTGRISGPSGLWLKRGGILIVDHSQSESALESMLQPLMQRTVRPTGWTAIAPDHEFMRSFYLLNSLPTCRGRPWKIFSFDGRVVAIASPYSLLAALSDQPAKWTCEANVDYEQQVRIFVNLLMMAFTTDYKRDQIHLPEILKRLRVP
jgi:hypothetical protein